MIEPIRYFDRVSGTMVTESVMGDGALRFAYETLAGRTLWPILFGGRAVSSLLGAWYDSHFSRGAIRALATIPGCTPEEAEKPLADYPTFNAFFTRRLKHGARPLGADFVSPADGRLLVYPAADLDAPFPLKGAQRTLRTVLDAAAAAVPSGRYDIAVTRLAPVDYHRFHFSCDCRDVGTPHVLKGRYHSVNPVALVRQPDVYAVNERVVRVFEAAFGRFFTVDVGAFGVGTIVQTDAAGSHAKGDERGYFKFGGSTVITVTPAGALRYDADILERSAAGVETRVLCGMRVATAGNRLGKGE